MWHIGLEPSVNILVPKGIVLKQIYSPAFNPKRNMQKILTLKYMRGPRGPQKCNGIT